MKLLTRTGKYLHLMKLMLIVLVLSFGTVNAQNVTGLVRDDAGKALPGVSVLVKGSQVGTSTDVSGKYDPVSYTHLTLPTNREV